MDGYKFLDDLKIKYVEMEHQPVYTAKQAEFIEESMNGIGCKNLFLKSGDQYYLYILKANKRAELKVIAKQINSKRLSFASDEELEKYLKLTPGSVSPLGIINDDGKVIVIIDQSIINQQILVHPNNNRATISINYVDLLLIINKTNHRYIIV